MGDGLHEVRTNLPNNRIARVLFYIDSNEEMVLLHGIIKNRPHASLRHRDCTKKQEATPGRSMKNKHTGTTFDSFLEEEGIKDEVESVAVKRVLAWQFQKAMQEQRKTKKAMAKDLHTSRSQLDRLLDPTKLSVTLDTIHKAAKVLHKGVRIEIVDLNSPGDSDSDESSVVRISHSHRAKRHTTAGTRRPSSSKQ